MDRTLWLEVAAGLSFSMAASQVVISVWPVKPVVTKSGAPMKFGIRTLLAVIVGMALAFALVVAVEWFSSVVHPFPADFDGNVAEHVRRYPHWVLGVVVLAWGATSTAATWVASRVGNRLAGSVVALLLAWALIFNVTMLPYTMWFKVVMISVCPVACLLGIRWGQRAPSPAAGASVGLRSS